MIVYTKWAFAFLNSPLITPFIQVHITFSLDAGTTWVQLGDGTYQTVKGSKFKEELSEINIAGGIEWWYNETFAVRSGVFYESRNKGNRQYLNLGASLKYNMFGIDFSYLASLNGRQNPLSNTLRFTLRLYLGEKQVKAADV